MNLEKVILDSICRSSEEVFSTMLGVELAPGERSVERGAPDPNDGVVSFIGLAGSWAGTGSICCSPALACRICAQMLMTESPAVNEEVLDAVAELTNMIIGSAKTELELTLGPLGLSIPTVVFGRNFRTKSAGTTEWLVVRYPWEDDILVVKVCLTQSDRATHPATHAQNHACPLDV
jgi:chemotaxis protein CheX